MYVNNNIIDGNLVTLFTLDNHLKSNHAIGSFSSRHSACNELSSIKLEHMVLQEC
jgi:hypothetical protein